MVNKPLFKRETIQFSPTPRYDGANTIFGPVAYSEEFAGRKGVIRIFARDESHEPGLLFQGQGGETPFHRYLTCGINGGNSEVCSLDKSI